MDTSFDWDQLSPNIAESYVDNIIPIYAHNKVEVVTFLKSHCKDSLLKLRKRLHSDLSQKFSAWADRTLYARINIDLLATDVYVLGLCLVNNQENLEPKDLKQIVKLDNSHALLLSQSEADIDHSAPPVVEMLGDIHSMLRQLLTAVTRLEQRMSSIEGDVTRARLHDAARLHDVARVEPDNEHAPSGDGETPECDGARTRDGDANPPAQAVRNELVANADDSEDELEDFPPPGSPAVGFRFQGSSGQRHQVKAPPVRAAAVASSPPPLELSNRFAPLSEGKRSEPRAVEFVVKAASTPANHSLFVGKLDPTTTEKKVRDHLYNIGVNQKDIADVSVIKSRAADRYSAFCITVGSNKAKDTVLKGSNWPEGVVKHPYSGPKHKRYGSNRSNKKEQKNSGQRSYSQYQKYQDSRKRNYQDSRHERDYYYGRDRSNNQRVHY